MSEKLQVLRDILESLESLKKDLYVQNESGFVSLIFYLAKKIAVKEIEENPDSVLPVIKSVVEDLHQDERIVIHLSSEDLLFIESLSEKLDKNFDFLKKVRLESSDEIQSGGCFIETEYGSVDATLEQRLSLAWQTLMERVPKTKAKSTADHTPDEEG